MWFSGVENQFVSAIRRAQARKSESMMRRRSVNPISSNSNEMLESPMMVAETSFFRTWPMGFCCVYGTRHVACMASAYAGSRGS